MHASSIESKQLPCGAVGSCDAGEFSRDRYGTGGTKRAGKRLRSTKQNRKPNPEHVPEESDDTQLRSGSEDASAEVAAIVEEPLSVEKEQAEIGQDNHRPTIEEVYPEKARARRRKRIAKRALAVVGIFLAVVLVGGSAFAFWFMSSLDERLAPKGDDTASTVSEALVPTVSGDPFYMLLLGSDSREGGWSWTESEMGDNERSDVMILVRVDGNNKKLTLLSIPRDTPYKKPDGTYEKINEVYNDEGLAGSIRAVSQLTGAKISHYAEVHISGLQEVVDLLGGVSVDVPIELTYNTTSSQEDITIKPGRQTINGEQAEIFARARHEYGENQEAHRQNAVKQLLTAIIEKTLSRPVAEIPGLVLQEASYIDTDLKSADIVSLAMGFSGGSDDMTIYTGTGPSEGDNNPEANGQWLCFENPEGWAAVMDVVDAGGDPNGMDFSETSIPWPEKSEKTKKE